MAFGQYFRAHVPGHVPAGSPASPALANTHPVDFIPRGLLSFLYNSLTRVGGSTRSDAQEPHRRCKRESLANKRRHKGLWLEGGAAARRRNYEQSSVPTCMARILLPEATFHSTLQQAQLITPQPEYQNLTWLNAATRLPPRLPSR